MSRSGASGSSLVGVAGWAPSGVAAPFFLSAALGSSFRPALAFGSTGIASFGAAALLSSAFADFWSCGLGANLGASLPKCLGIGIVLGMGFEMGLDSGLKFLGIGFLGSGLRTSILVFTGACFTAAARP